MSNKYKKSTIEFTIYKNSKQNEALFFLRKSFFQIYDLSNRVKPVRIYHTSTYITPYKEQKKFVGNALMILPKYI